MRETGGGLREGANSRGWQRAQRVWLEFAHSHRNALHRNGQLAFAVVLSAAALQRCTRQVSTSEGDGVAPPQPSFSLVADAPWPAPYAHDRLWLEAARGDDIDRARLAQREGAHTLLSVIERGGSLGRTALDSLEFAADRLDIRADLCALAGRAEESTLGLLMEALLEVLANASWNEETVDARADAGCLRVLTEIQQRPNLTDTDRDRVLGAARRLSSR